MKKIILFNSILFLLIAASSCSKPDGIDMDTSFLSTAASSNVDKIFDITTDNSGSVKVTPIGEGVTSFIVDFGHGSATANVAPGASASHIYPEGSYTVSITATDIAGKQTTTTYPLDVKFRAPENVTISTSNDMAVAATALYAKSFLVYYGDVASETGTPMAVGQTLPSHVYPATGGPFTLKVVALSGGAATTAVTKTLFGFPIDFENASVNYFFGTFGTGQQFATVDNPSATGLNTSAKVGKFTKGAEGWSGTYSPLDIAANFAYGKKIKVLVYNPAAANIGKLMNVELEWYVGASAANPWGAVVKAPLTKSGQWEELVFDFSTIAAIPTTTPLPRFTQLVLRFNDAANGNSDIIYVDNFRLTN